MVDIISKILKYLKKRKDVVVIVARITIWAVLLVWSISATLVCASLSSDKEALKSTNNELASQVENQKSTISKSDEKSAELTQKVIDLEEEVKNYKAEVEKLEQENNKLSTKSNNTTVYVDNTNMPYDRYPEATYVWNYLKGIGLNDYVCAGIIGNIMAEIGGQTLDFSRWQDYSKKTYYGICQWAGGRKDRLLNDYGKSLEAQCKFLGVELFEVIPQDSTFYTMQNEKDAALYFAKYYERCNSKYYAIRQTNATRALEYFA